MKTYMGVLIKSASPKGASNEYSQHAFSWRNKKNINTFGLKKASYEELRFLDDKSISILSCIYFCLL